MKILQKKQKLTMVERNVLSSLEVWKKAQQIRDVWMRGEMNRAKEILRLKNKGKHENKR